MVIKSKLVREVIAEYIGTTILILIGDSVLATLHVSRKDENWQAIAPLAWGVAIFCAVHVAGGVSAHLNPAVTVSMVTVKKFPVNKVPAFFAAQYLGAFTGAALVYCVYYSAINELDGGTRVIYGGPTATGPIFACYPKESVTTLNCFVDQVVSTALMLIVVEAVTDERNHEGVPKHLVPLLLGFMIVALIFSFAYNCQAPLNPARDLGPRVFTAVAGWGGGVFSFRDYNWFWVPILGPHIGAILGVWIYKLAIGDHLPQLEEEDDMTTIKTQTGTTSAVPTQSNRISCSVIEPKLREVLSNGDEKSANTVIKRHSITAPTYQLHT